MEDKFLVELLDSKYEEARNRFRDKEYNHEDLTIMMLKHQTNHIAHLEVDLNNKIDNLDAKIEEQGKSLNAKIEEQGRSINQRIDKLEVKVDNSFRWLIGTIVSMGGIIIAAVALLR